MCSDLTASPTSLPNLYINYIDYNDYNYNYINDFNGPHNDLRYAKKAQPYRGWTPKPLSFFLITVACLFVSLGCWLGTNTHYWLKLKG